MRRMYVLQDSLDTNSVNMTSSTMSEQETNVLCCARRESYVERSFGVLPFWEDCVHGKYKRVSFKHFVHNTKGILDYVHSDLWGPSRKVSLGGCSYLRTFIDDYLKKVWCFIIKTKDEVMGVH